MNATEQFRILKLQVFNWGTFSGVHDVPVAEKGFLFVGRSGSGKTTLLDAFSALLVPPKWIDFNAAAREGERGRDRDRSLISYVRGAWAEQQQDDSGLIATRYLRPSTSWSALALTYRNASGEVIVLVQLFWIRGKSNSRDDLHRYFLIFERLFDLRELDFQLDVRRLKQKFPDAFAREDFAPYAERFRRRLGIDNELALKLLHKTQSAKNLGDLNTFLRDFMLDKPETFNAAERFVLEFGELNVAHKTVITAREQIETLVPALAEYLGRQSVVAHENELSEVQKALDSYKQTYRVGLLQEEIGHFESELARGRASEQTLQQTLKNTYAALEDLQRRRRDAGGQQIEDLQGEKGRLLSVRDGRLRRLDEAQVACRKLGRQFPQTPSGFGELTTMARRDVERWPEEQEQSRERHVALSAQRSAFEKEFSEAKEEVEALRRQSSNVPARMLKLRAAIASHVGVSEAALPFAAELVEVRENHTEWRGAIERVLRGFALSIIVEERYYTAVSDLVNGASLNDRLLYNRVMREQTSLSGYLDPNLLFHKLEIKEGPFKGYLTNTLIKRFDYVCVESMHAFRKADRALTREGQVRHGKDRHEKDDRFGLNDRERWILGFDNRAKLALFEKKAADSARSLEEMNLKIRSLRREDDVRSQQLLCSQTLSNMQWEEIDVVSISDRISAIDRTLRELHEANVTLQELDPRIEKQKKAVENADNALRDVKAEIKRIDQQIVELRSELDSLKEQLRHTRFDEVQTVRLSAYFKLVGQTPTLKNLDRVGHEVDRKIGEELRALAETRNRLGNSIERRFVEFQRRWASDASDLDATLASAPDYFAKLKRLESDRLPDYEQRFFDLLRNQSHQNLAALSTHISQARKTIFDRLELVNQSLSQAEFGPATYLNIYASDRNLDDVRQFKQEIQQALSHAWTDDREQAEERFLILRDLVERLGSEEPEKKRWRSLVLDVRLHVEFIGRELDAEGKQVEVYRGGTGKSGGQRQKLATTCLAAALRYQLGGDDHGLPQYAPVVLDEAFDKADNEFTALAMNIFAEFGFQMIVATPLKSVMTLEPFIGGACFVDIAERQRSSVLIIEYDDERKRLNLPERTRNEVSAAVS